MHAAMAEGGAGRHGGVASHALLQLQICTDARGGKEVSNEWGCGVRV